MSNVEKTEKLIEELSIEVRLTLILAEIKKANKKLKKLKNTIRGLKK